MKERNGQREMPVADVHLAFSCGLHLHVVLEIYKMLFGGANVLSGSAEAVSTPLQTVHFRLASSQ